jgi:magnesium chelatase subunit I
MKPAFPFTALVGQDEMKQALLLCAVDPQIGGILVFGDRGTGKSTAVRALAALLPPIEIRRDCPYNCDPSQPAQECAACATRRAPTVAKVPVPVVDLPLGATEDRIAGSLDLERALLDGRKEFAPGLLARANRGFLYIDEVNLLEDHLVDLLLDVAASGINVVEREGLSLRHSARFVLVGSGNPEEGELRPQLLDRFGLCVEVGSPTDIDTRVEVVRRRDAFDTDPLAFVEAWKAREKRLRARIVAARRRLAAVQVPDEALRAAARLCVALSIDGSRGELTLMRTARAAAALDGDEVVSTERLMQVAPSALGHRLRRDPMDEAGSRTRVSRAIRELAPA